MSDGFTIEMTCIAEPVQNVDIVANIVIVVTNSVKWTVVMVDVWGVVIGVGWAGVG